MNFKKLSLVIAILISGLLISGCQKSQIINARYIRTPYIRGYHEGEYIIAKSSEEMTGFLEYGTFPPKKYDNDYFKTKSVIMFKLINTSYNTVNKIESYDINNGIININVVTAEYGDRYVLVTQNVYFELDNQEISKIDKVKILKNKIDITKKRIEYKEIDTKPYFTITPKEYVSDEYRVIKSHDELEPAINSYTGVSWYDKSILDIYDDNYFQNKLLILYVTTLEGVTAIRTLNSVVNTTDKTIIYLMQTFKNNRVEGLDSIYHTLIEVDEDSIKDNTKVELHTI